MAMNSASGMKLKKKKSPPARKAAATKKKSGPKKQTAPAGKKQASRPAAQKSSLAVKKPSSSKMGAARKAPASAKSTKISTSKTVRTPDRPAPERAPIAARRTAMRPSVPNEAMVDKRKLNGAASRDQDRVVVMVRDPYWLHVFWEISSESIQRTEAALGPDWYQAKPVLRLLDVSSEDTTSSTESTVADIEIHGGVNNWYIPLDGTSRSYRIDVGYITLKGRLFVLARSNVVNPPRPGASDVSDTHFSSIREESERIFAMSGGADPYNNSESLQRFFEERFGRPMSAGSLSSYGSGALGPARRERFHFDVDAELIVHGRTVPDARVCVHGEPVQLRKDGSFTLRFGMADGRQILPATASTNDGIEERTIIIAIERNTKVLEPMIHDGQE